MNYTRHENGIYTWPTLYKLTKGGKGQQWDIRVVPTPSLGDVIGASTFVNFGQIDGKIQQAGTFIDKGKNVGKKNETSPVEQAVSEADAKWLKQKDKGYSQSKGGASLDLKPMLAQKYEDVKEKVPFPCFLQPKLDGVRCIAHRSGDTIDFWSRQGKKHVGLDHIRGVLLNLMSDGEIFDGELYCHGMQFQTLVSLVKKDREESKQLQYHVYDIVSDSPFSERLVTLFTKLPTPFPSLLVSPVVTTKVHSHAEVESYHEQYVAQGYEGVMLRTGDCTYRRGYRSRELLKVKAFMDDDFLIVDVVPGVGKMANQGIFVCMTDQGRTFNVKPKGRDASREEYLLNKDRYIDKMLTVTYFSMTDGDTPVPRFPIGKSIRNYE